MKEYIMIVGLIIVIVVMGVQSYFTDLRMDSMEASNTTTILKVNDLSNHIDELSNKIQNNISTVGAYASQINNSLSNQIISLQSQITQIKNTPVTVSIWNVNQTVSKGYYIFGAMFDTFDNHIRLQANDSISIKVLESSEYANYQTGQSYFYIEKHFGTNIDFWFNLSEGCSGYVYIIESPTNSSFIVYPNVTATYNPSPIATGACSE